MKSPITVRRIVAAVPIALLMVVVQWTVLAGAGTRIKTGRYSGSTTQAAVAPGFRGIAFTVKKGTVTLTTEPSVAREDCVSAPVFTLDGTPSKKLGRNRTFTITHTFIGNKIDEIHGKFVAPNEIDGYALYHFAAQDLCSEGKSRVNFSAKHK